MEENNSLNAYKSGESELNKDSDKLNEEWNILYDILILYDLIN